MKLIVIFKTIIIKIPMRIHINLTLLNFKILYLNLVFIILFYSCSTKQETEFNDEDVDQIHDTLYPYFPSRMHAFVWRNWASVATERLAKVLNTNSENVINIGQSMGLPLYQKPSIDFEQRGYISLIRRNWHLISFEQMLILLNWNEEQLNQTLRDDDFLWVKVGGMKPAVSPIHYTSPSPDVQKRCVEIKKIVKANFGEELSQPQEERFKFIQNLSLVDENIKPTIPSTKSKDEQIRFIYSYFAPFGDPLLHPELDPFPDGLLYRLSQQGINGVWLHVVLHQLTSSKIFPELGIDHDIRMKNLKTLAKRASKYGVKIYLYMNEPRAMPPSFFENKNDIMGFEDQGFGTMCTSVPLVRQWIKESLSNVFKDIPELGGVFTISGSENLTNCQSRQQGEKCPRCSKRPPAEVIAEVNTSIAEGVWEGNPDAKVIVWDWGWPDGSAWGKNRWAADIISKLPDNVYHMSVSEWSKPIERGGIKTKVGEYSISVVGPGPRSQRLWSLAKERGLKTIAKVQVNNTWELSAIPYLPVMNLVANHIKNLQNENVDGLMLSWSLGGYPSPNLELVKYIQDHPLSSIENSLSKIAVDRYGQAAAPEVLKAWQAFSEAFTEFPYGLGIYFAPMNYGPSNPLYQIPTKKNATMLGFPYDDLEKWRGAYPANILADQFEKLSNKWKKGIPYFSKAIMKAETPAQKENAVEDHRFAFAAWIHFKSVANQIRFVIERERIAKTVISDNSEIIKIIESEIQLAKNMYKITKADSRIGFEASNHYYYFPLDFVEKTINCEYVLQQFN